MSAKCQKRKSCLVIQSPRRRGQAARAARRESAFAVFSDHGQKLGRCLHRQIGRFGAFENAIYVIGDMPVLVVAIRPAGNQAAFAFWEKPTFRVAPSRRVFGLALEDVPFQTSNCDIL